MAEFILQATSILKQYGIRTVLEFEKMQIYEGDRIGIVGANGAGKSTLMGILCGEIAPDRGSVIRRCEIGWIRQLPQREGTLSGGENAKRHIQRETYRAGDVLFADEPTANLDEDGVRWVRAKLLAARTVVLISHDRDLLDAVCNRIIEVRDGTLRFFTGNYSSYEQALAEQRARQQMEYGRYQRKKAQLENAVHAQEQHVARQRQKKRREYANNGSEARLGGHKRKASMQKQERIRKVLEGRLERLEAVERVKEPPRIAIDFSLTAPPGNKLVIVCEGLDFSYGEHEIFSGAAFTVRNGAHIALTGVNGVGKSTLLRLVREGHSAIRCVPKLRPGFLYQQFENIDPCKTVIENVLESAVQDHVTVRNVLAGLLFRGDDVQKRAEVLSGGERMRLSLAMLITGAYNALLLDEPTNYLDMRSLEAAEQVLRDYPGTLLLVSHDRRFVEATTTEELRIEGGKIHPGNQTLQPSPVERTLLELRRLRLLDDISVAPPERKEMLEVEYAHVVEQLRQL